MSQPAAVTHYRTVFVSDVHLGTPQCQAEMLLDFLRDVNCEQLFLVGDIVDAWEMKRAWYWPQNHDDVVQEILRKGREGTRITYVPGNHDAGLRDFCGVHFGGVEVARDAVHVTADGRAMLVVHGDEFFRLARPSRSSRSGAVVGLAYRALLRLNTLLNRVLRGLGAEYWSLLGFVKSRSGRARAFVEAFERQLSAEAARRGLDGVVCGHIHKSALREIEGVIYANDGDWVESCTALVEHADGRLEILDWAARVRAVARRARESRVMGSLEEPALA